VSEVVPQSAAAVAGIVPGDILLRVDGMSIDNPDDIKVAVADAVRGSMVEVKLLRRALPVWVHVQL
jgi:S1-C subfamily serine protease